MREYLFRGKTKDGKWVEGYLVCSPNGDSFECYIISDFDERDSVYDLGDFAIKVIPETVSQYCGLIDKKGKKIFEGDILHIKSAHGVDCVVGKGIIYYDDCLFQYRVREIKPCAEDSEIGVIYRNCDLAHIDRFEVIGNIYDNPELLEAE